MSKKHLDQCRTGREVVDYAVTQGAEVKRQSGSHVILGLPNGDMEIVPNHAKELGKGLRVKIIKHLLAAGITIFVVVFPLLVRLA